MALTIERLKAELDYNPDTGVFIRKKNSGGLLAGTVAGGTNQDGYIRLRVGGKKYMAHRLAWFWCHGEFPEDEIDHINCVRDDNRISNLRNSDRVGNCANRRLRKGHSTGLKGVRRHGKRFVASCGGGADRYLGVYDTAEAAHAAYLKAANDNFGEFARAA